MLAEVIEIHDKYTFEMKLGFVGKEGVSKNNFNLNVWLFVPGSLDINPDTYVKADFYKDLKSHIRLITPVFLLKDIAAGNHSPILLIKKTLNQLIENRSKLALNDVEYQIKMFNSILKSSLREDLRNISKLRDEAKITLAVDNYLLSIELITSEFRTVQARLGEISSYTKALDFFLFGDEYMSTLIERNCFKLYRFIENKGGELKKSSAPKLLSLLRTEIAYKKSHGFLTLEKGDLKNNNMMVLRHRILKKYTESDLYVNTKKKEDGFLIRQFVYSLAAGLSMVFATVVAFSFQQEYGNFTMPFFVALVVGYMLKDRIKELSRFYFAHKFDNAYFDLKTLISIGKDKIGFFKESFGYESNEKVPAEILKARNRSSLLEANNKFNEEQIMHYRIQAEIDNDLIRDRVEYNASGVNNIIRFNIAELTRKMDNPDVLLYSIDENGETIFEKADKVYYVNMVLRLQQGDKVQLKNYRLVLNKDGIKEIEKIS